MNRIFCDMFTSKFDQSGCQHDGFPSFRGTAAVILAHPHPSGVTEPSQVDELITTGLRDALSLIEGRILDHHCCR
jgi:hypothetical protein